MKGRFILRQMLSFFLLILFTVISTVGMKEMIIVLPLLVVLLNSHRATYIETMYCLLTGCIIAGLIVLGEIKFPMFPQAAVLYEQNEDVIYWIKTGHIHAIRLLIVYPGVVLGKLPGFELNLGVTIYSASLLVLIQYFMMRMMNINNSENKVSGLLAGLLIVALSYLMNGRLIFVFFGISLLTLCELKFREREISIFMLQIVTAISIVFTMVSSGTMFVTFVYTVMMIPFRWKKLRKAGEKLLYAAILMVSAIPVINIFVPYLIKMTEKNITFYGGGFQGAINLINHGLGKIVNTSDNLLVLLFFAIGAIVLFANIYLFKHRIIQRDHPNLPLFLLVNLGIYGSIFGISTGLTALIPLLVLVIEKMNRSYRLV